MHNILMSGNRAYKKSCGAYNKLSRADFFDLQIWKINGINLPKYQMKNSF